MKAVLATELCLGVDSLATLGAPNFDDLVQHHYQFRAGYIDHMTPAELALQLSKGLAYIPVTYADEFDAAHGLARLQALQIPLGTTVFLDIESVGALEPADLIARITAWAAKMVANGYRAGLYVGIATKLTWRELYVLPNITAYWQGCSIEEDREGNPQVPYPRGWCLIQGRRFNLPINGVLFDVDFLTADDKDCVPYWVVAD